MTNKSHQVQAGGEACCWDSVSATRAFCGALDFKKRISVARPSGCNILDQEQFAFDSALKYSEPVLQLVQ